MTGEISGSHGDECEDVFLDVLPCSRRFSGFYCLHHRPKDLYRIHMIHLRYWALVNTVINLRIT